MVAVEPAHLARLAKACPRPGCGSSNVKWRYYNNKRLSQPRYVCLGCNELFTFGGNIRPSKEGKLQAALREADVGGTADGAALKKKGPRIKITPGECGASSNLGPGWDLRFMMESHPKRRRNMISSPNDLPVQSASPISKRKRMRGGGILLRLATGRVISLPGSSSDEESQVEVDAGADMSSSTEIGELFVGFEEMAGEFVTMFGGSEPVAICEQWRPSIQLASSDQLRCPIVECGGSSGPEPLDLELESLLIDAELSSLSWEDIDKI